MSFPHPDTFSAHLNTVSSSSTEGTLLLRSNPQTYPAVGEMTGAPMFSPQSAVRISEPMTQIMSQTVAQSPTSSPQYSMTNMRVALPISHPVVDGQSQAQMHPAQGQVVSAAHSHPQVVSTLPVFASAPSPPSHVHPSQAARAPLHPELHALSIPHPAALTPSSFPSSSSTPAHPAPAVDTAALYCLPLPTVPVAPSAPVTPATDTMYAAAEAAHAAYTTHSSSTPSAAASEASSHSCAAPYPALYAAADDDAQYLAPADAPAHSYSDPAYADPSTLSDTFPAQPHDAYPARQPHQALSAAASDPALPAAATETDAASDTTSTAADSVPRPSPLSPSPSLDNLLAMAEPAARPARPLEAPAASDSSLFSLPVPDMSAIASLTALPADLPATSSASHGSSARDSMLDEPAAGGPAQDKPLDASPSPQARPPRSIQPHAHSDASTSAHTQADATPAPAPTDSDSAARPASPQPALAPGPLTTFASTLSGLTASPSGLNLALPRGASALGLSRAGGGTGAGLRGVTGNLSNSSLSSLAMARGVPPSGSALTLATATPGAGLPRGPSSPALSLSTLASRIGPPPLLQHLSVQPDAGHMRRLGSAQQLAPGEGGAQGLHGMAGMGGRGGSSSSLAPMAMHAQSGFSSLYSRQPLGGKSAHNASGPTSAYLGAYPHPHALAPAPAPLHPGPMGADASMPPSLHTTQPGLAQPFVMGAQQPHHHHYQPAQGFPAYAYGNATPARPALAPGLGTPPSAALSRGPGGMGALRLSPKSSARLPFGRRNASSSSLASSSLAYGDGHAHEHATGESLYPPSQASTPLSMMSFPPTPAHGHKHAAQSTLSPSATMLQLHQHAPAGPPAMLGEGGAAQMGPSTQHLGASMPMPLAQTPPLGPDPAHADLPQPTHGQPQPLSLHGLHLAQTPASSPASAPHTDPSFSVAMGGGAGVAMASSAAPSVSRRGRKRKEAPSAAGLYGNMLSASSATAPQATFIDADGEAQYITSFPASAAVAGAATESTALDVSLPSDGPPAPLHHQMTSHLQHAAAASPIALTAPKKRRGRPPGSGAQRGRGRKQSSDTRDGRKPTPLCPVCQKCFRDKYYLDRHLVTHTGEKNYECALCRLKFSQEGHLTRHLKTIHASTVNAQCTHCQAVFYSARALSERFVDCPSCMLSSQSHAALLARNKAVLEQLEGGKDADQEQ